MSVTRTNEVRMLDDIGKAGFTFDSVEDMKQSTAVVVGQKVRTLGYYTPGDGGGNDYEIVVAGTGADDGGSFIDLAGSGLQAKGLFGREIDVRQFGAIGSEVVDSAAQIASALKFASSEKVPATGSGQSYLCMETINEYLSNGLTLSNINMIYDGAVDQHFFFRFRTEGDVWMAGCVFDASSKAAKVVHILPNASDVKVSIETCTFRNGLQTEEGSSTGSGVQITPDDNMGYFKSTNITGCVFENITSNRLNPEGVSVVAVGRGVTVSECEHTTITNSFFRDIGPYWDGDGLAVYCNQSVPGRRETFALQVSACEFIDCHKRSIKAQVARTVVDNITCRRTKPFEFYAGQAEIGLLEGGTATNILCYYAPGSAPRHLFSLSVANRTSSVSPSMSISNLTADFEDPNDVLESIGRFSLERDNTTIKNATMYDIHVGCRVNTLLSLRTNNQSELNKKFDNVVLSNVYVRGFVQGDAGKALVVLTRGSSSWNDSNIKFFNCVAEDGSRPNDFYLDTSPGTISYYRSDIKSIFATPIIGRAYTSQTPTNSTTYRWDLSEGSSKNVIFKLGGQIASTTKVCVTFNTTRADGAGKLWLEGFVFGGGGRTYYKEFFGNKSSGLEGSIDVVESSTNHEFTVVHNAGSGSNTGTFMVTIEDIGHITEIIEQ